MTGPFGTEINGFKVSILSSTDPSTIERTYEDIERILRGNRQPFKEVEEKTPSGTFKSFVIET